MTITETKHGTYPCSYAEFVELRKAHKTLFKAYVDVKRYLRWEAKTKYRKGSAPIHCPDLIQSGLHIAGEKKWFGKGFIKAKGHNENVFHMILTAYHLARFPRSSVITVPTLVLPSGWKDIVSKIDRFYSDEAMPVPPDACHTS